MELLQSKKSSAKELVKSKVGIGMIKHQTKKILVKKGNSYLASQTVDSLGGNGRQDAGCKGQQGVGDCHRGNPLS
jgi:hypothetical protein